VSAYVNSVYGVLFRHFDGLVLDGKVDKGLDNKFAYLSAQIPPKLRIPVLTMFLEYEMGKTNDASEISFIIDKYFKNDSSNVYNSYVRSKFQNLVELKKGLPAPTFILEDESGSLVSLEGLRGKVVFIDFWFSACAPCHVLFKQLIPVKEYFKDQPSVVFLNVSIDKDQLWKESLSRYRIQGFHAFTQNMGSEHRMIKDYKVVQYPTTFLIDKNGTIFNANPPDNPDELIGQIQRLLEK
jgi:cytochrome oxidase Cu insertion factor (SCO1/SenC/PrrC family)